MDTRDLSVARVKIIALSRIHQIVDDVRRNPLGYRKDTREYCDAMYEIIDTMPEDRLTETVTSIYNGYAEVGMADEGYTASTSKSSSARCLRDDFPSIENCIEISSEMKTSRNFF